MFLGSRSLKVDIKSRKLEFLKLHIVVDRKAIDELKLKLSNQIIVAI